MDTRLWLQRGASALGTALVLALVVWTVAFTDTFHLARVAVEGNQQTEAWEVRSVLHPWLGQHVLSLDVDELARDVMALPWVRTVKVQTDLPDRIVVRIAEYTAALIVKQGVDLWYATAEGVVFAAVDPERVLDLPILTVSTELEADDLHEVVQGALALVARAEGTPLVGRVSAVHHDERLGYALEIGTIEVHVGWDLAGFDPARVGIALAWLPVEARVPAAVFQVAGTEDLIVRLHGGISSSEAAAQAEPTATDLAGK